MNVLGLFSGIGGFELGLRNSGMNISAYCEIESHCLSVLRKNFPEAKEFTDIRDLSPAEGEYDVLCGAFTFPHPMRYTDH